MRSVVKGFQFGRMAVPKIAVVTYGKEMNLRHRILRKPKVTLSLPKKGK